MRSNHDVDPAALSVLSPRAGISRRELLRFAGASFALLVSPVGFAAATSLVAVRVWPGTEYTRITLESPREIEFSHMTLDSPDRLVIDLKGVEFNAVIKSLPEKVLESDPLIGRIRAAVNPASYGWWSTSRARSNLRFSR